MIGNPGPTQIPHGMISMFACINYMLTLNEFYVDAFSSMYLDKGIHLFKNKTVTNVNSVNW